MLMMVCENCQNELECGVNQYGFDIDIKVKPCNCMHSHTKFQELLEQNDQLKGDHQLLVTELDDLKEKIKGLI